MRVGLIIYDSIHTVTGGYIYDYKLVEYLQSQGVVVKIFSQPRKNFFGLFKNNFSKRIFNNIIKFSPDILLQDEMNYLSLFLMNKKLKRIGNFPIISVVHLLQSNLKHNVLTGWVIKLIENSYLKSVNGFIFNSLSTKNSVEKRVVVNANYLVAYPGKDRLRIEKTTNISLKCYKEKLQIIFVGNILYNKGLHVLLHALSQIDKNLWQLSVIGALHFDLKYSKKILNLISQLRLSENVSVLGILNIENLRQKLAIHHVLVVPSYYESFGIVYAEAMGAGLPVIATKLGGAKEIVVDNINGFLVTPGDIAMVRDAITKLAKNRELLIKMSYSSLSAYETLPSWDQSMEQVFNFLCHNRRN